MFLNQVRCSPMLMTQASLKRGRWNIQGQSTIHVYFIFLYTFIIIYLYLVLYFHLYLFYILFWRRGIFVHEGPSPFNIIFYRDLKKILPGFSPARMFMIVLGLMSALMKKLLQLKMFSWEVFWAEMLGRNSYKEFKRFILYA